MNPFYFDSAGTPLYAVYHSPEGVGRGEGIVVSQPLGNEYYRCYRSLQVLCSELADRGYHVLRFDFANTGNSADTDTLDFDTWVGNISHAVRELADISGVDAISVIGCRLGAAASLHLGDSVPSLKHLVLWDPVLDGGSFLESLDTLHAQVCRAHPGGQAGAPALLDASSNERVGLQLTPALRATIGAIEPTSFAIPRSGHVTIVATREAPLRLSEVFANADNTDVLNVISDCGWCDAGRFTEGLSPAEALEALRKVFLP